MIIFFQNLLKEKKRFATLKQKIKGIFAFKKFSNMYVNLHARHRISSSILTFGLDSEDEGERKID